MPLFSHKFSPKKIPVRKQETSIIKKEFGADFASKESAIEVDKIALKLNDFHLCFEDGQWVPVSGKAGAAHKENIRLRKSVKQLEEENNLLRLKFEIVLDMLTEKATQSEHTIDDIRSHTKSLEF